LKKKDAGSPDAGLQWIKYSTTNMAVAEEITVTHVHHPSTVTNGESLHMAPQVQTGKKICHQSI
jgi:hypothetical protein